MLGRPNDPPILKHYYRLTLDSRPGAEAPRQVRTVLSADLSETVEEPIVASVAGGPPMKA